MPTRNELVRQFAYELVHFNHDPNTAYLVIDVTDDCMLELEGMSGLFSPSLFRPAKKDAVKKWRNEVAGPQPRREG